MDVAKFKFKPYYICDNIVNLECLTKYYGCDVDIYFNYNEEYEKSIPTRINITNDDEHVHANLTKFLQGIKKFSAKFIDKHLRKGYSDDDAFKCKIGMEIYYRDTAEGWLEHDSFSSGVFYISQRTTLKNIIKILEDIYLNFEKEQSEMMLLREWTFHHVRSYELIIDWPK